MMGNEIQVNHASDQAVYALVRNGAGQVWHPAAAQFEDWGADGHTMDDYDLPLTDAGGGLHIGDFPDDTAPGRYTVQAFGRAGANPANGDPLVWAGRIVWTGTGDLTAEKLLANRAVQDKSTGAIDYYDDDGATVLLTHAPVDGELTIERSR